MKLEKTKVEECTGIRSKDGSHIGNIWVSTESLKLFIRPEYETHLILIEENGLEIQFVRKDKDEASTYSRLDLSLSDDPR